MSLKPVVFVQGKYAYSRQNTTQQIMLLKALKITQDPKKLRAMIGVKAVADVYRTLDKMAMRKEYHGALAKSGITFDYVVDKIKGVIDTAEKDSDRLSGLNMILKSIGLDKYEETETAAGGWEDELLKVRAEEEQGLIAIEVPEYAVIEPMVPEEVRLRKEKANIETRKMYD